MQCMKDEHTESARGNLADVTADLPGDSGWIKTRIAAEALGVDPRTIRAYIERGDLLARSEGEGIQKTYLVSIDSVYALRDRRRSSAKKRTPASEGRGKSARNVTSPDARGATTGTTGWVPAEDLVDIIRDLAAETALMSAEAAEFKTRLELSTQAESTLRENLERERERADRLEVELASLREEQKPSLESQDASETAHEGLAEDTVTSSGPQEPAPRRERSWWRRFFGFS